MGAPGAPMSLISLISCSFFRKFGIKIKVSEGWSPFLREILDLPLVEIGPKRCKGNCSL